MELKKYSKDGNISFCFGAFPTYELLKNKGEETIEIIVHENLVESEETNKILSLARAKNIPIRTNGRVIEKLSGKGNIYIMGVFKKYKTNVDHNANQVLLVNP